MKIFILNESYILFGKLMFVFIIWHCLMFPFTLKNELFYRQFQPFLCTFNILSLLFVILNNKMKIPHTFTKLNNTIHKKWYYCLGNDVETSFSYHFFCEKVYPFPQMPVYRCKYITIPKNAIITDIEITHLRVIHQNVSTRFLKQEKENSFP